jgi:Fungalysin metallopeptidase (M36)
MTINFIPNDPLAGASMPTRRSAPRPNRPSNRAGFKFFDSVPEGLFDQGTPEFLFWQCREAALLSVEVWETLNGNLTKWARNRKRLDLQQDAGDDLNAFYDTHSLSFFHHSTGNKTTFSGESTDVVAHEAGHAFLDSLRPDIWGSTFTEVGAFHEAFGDCMAILVALFDQPTRRALLDISPNLRRGNFTEATAEDLSDGVRRALGSSHPASAPRHALNNFRFQLPTTLPPTGGPNALTSEIHSFGRIFSGCFYDLISNLFAASPQRNEAGLLAAAKTAGKLLIAGARKAPETQRFFQAVGRAMVLEDQAVNGGANRQQIIDAFARHDIALGSAAMVAPRASLEGKAPKLGAKAKKPTLSAATTKDLRKRIGAAPGSKLAVSAVEIGDERVAQVVHYREVPLGSLSKQLKGVVAVAAEPMLVGEAGGRAALVSALPEPNTTTDEVHTFVDTLLKNDQIAFDGRARAVKARRVGAVNGRQPHGVPTHKVVTRDGKKVLTRIRFACAHCD